MGELWGCAKHARLGKTCCQDAEVLITAEDKRRVGAFTGREDFWRDAWPADISYVDDGSDPGWALAFNVDGSRPVLKRRENGDCTFLSATGCTLPLEVRPLVCRLYPYAYDEHGLRGTSSHRCPAEVVPPGKTIAELLEMDEVQAERWRSDLYREIRESPGRGR